MSDSRELISNIISLSAAFCLIYKFAMPVLKKSVKMRRNLVIKEKMQLQSKLKKARLHYEESNYSYLKSFERKAVWQEEANIILKKKLDLIYKDHNNSIEDLRKAYEDDLKIIESSNRKRYVNDLVSAFSLKLSKKQISYSSLISKITK